MVGVSRLDFDFISDEARHNYMGLPDWRNNGIYASGVEGGPLRRSEKCK